MQWLTFISHLTPSCQISYNETGFGVFLSNFYDSLWDEESALQRGVVAHPWSHWPFDLGDAIFERDDKVRFVRIHLWLDNSTGTGGYLAQQHHLTICRPHRPGSSNIRSFRGAQGRWIFEYIFRIGAEWRGEHNPNKLARVCLFGSRAGVGVCLGQYYFTAYLWASINYIGVLEGAQK